MDGASGEGLCSALLAKHRKVLERFNKFRPTPRTQHARLFGVRDDVADDAGVTHDIEIEPPVSVNPSLPEIQRRIILLGAQRGMPKITFQQFDLLKKCLLNLRRSVTQSFDGPG